MIDWESAYRVAIGLLALSYGVQFILFLILCPDTPIEWATTAGAATICGFFAILSYWFSDIDQGPQPVVYPPLVLAAIAACIASAIFSVVATRHWLDRRRVRKKGRQ